MGTNPVYFCESIDIMFAYSRPVEAICDFFLLPDRDTFIRACLRDRYSLIQIEYVRTFASIQHMRNRVSVSSGSPAKAPRY